MGQFELSHLTALVSPEMTEIPRTVLLELFIGKQTVSNVRLNAGSINFDVCEPDTETETGKVDPRTVSQGDLEDIAGFFSNTLQSRPFAKHLLQILWIREFRFNMGLLENSNMYDFIHDVFCLHGVDLDEETIQYEFFELLNEGYLQKMGLGFSLTSQGKLVAEKMFRAMQTLIPSNVESDDTPAITGELLAILEKLASVSLAPVMEGLKEVKVAVEKSVAISRKGFRSLKQVSHQSLAELVETLPPLKLEREDGNWVTVSTAQKHTGETLDNLRKQRYRGERILLNGLEYGKDTEKRIWCHVSGSRKVFYLKETLSGYTLSR